MSIVVGGIGRALTVIGAIVARGYGRKQLGGGGQCQGLLLELAATGGQMAALAGSVASLAVLSGIGGLLAAQTGWESNTEEVRGYEGTLVEVGAFGGALTCETSCQGVLAEVIA